MMKYYLVTLSVLMWISYSHSTPISVKKDLANLDNNENIEIIDEVEEIVVTPPAAETEKEILVSKDNIIPLLRTVVLAVTHKKDPTYKEVLKLGGKQLFKLTEKKIGHDKHMKGLLKIIQKYMEDFEPDNMEKKEEELLGELAEKYLRTHKFRLLFPESLLLHQPEMDMFISKMRNIGTLEGRQMQFDLRNLLDRIDHVYARMRNSFNDLDLFGNFSLAGLRKQVTSIGTRIDEFLPTLRNGAALGLGGLSMGSITALAAAGALISAPFFVSAFRSQFREEEDFYNINRRVSMGSFPPEHVAGAVPGKPLVMTQPDWMNNYEHNTGIIYAPKKNPFYSEPKFSLHPVEPKEIPATNAEDVAYNKYLKEYNEWLEQYHNTLNLVPNDNQEYKDYYQKYKEWYAKYYKEHFGEDPPNYDKKPVSLYGENSILNMQPPPQSLEDTVSNVQTVYKEKFESSDAIKYPQNISPKFPQRQSQNHNVNSFKPAVVQSQLNPAEKSAFSVFHLKDAVSEERSQETATPQEYLPTPAAQESLPTPSPLISDSNTASSSNNEVYFHRANPKPVYIPNGQDFLQPAVSLQAPTVVNEIEPSPVFYEIKPPQIQLQPESIPQEETEDENALGGFLSSKSESIFDLPNVKFEEEVEQTESVNDIKFNDLDLQNAVPVPYGDKMPNDYEVKDYVYEKEVEPEVQVPRYETTNKPVISYVTSGVFKTTPLVTPKAETTPRPYYKKPIEQSVRVVTSTSVVTSAPFIKKSEKPNDMKKKFTLTDLLKKHEKKFTKNIEEKEEENEEVNQEPIIEERIDVNIDDLEKKIGLEEDKLSQRISSYGEELPIYALDPFYGPRLSRTDAIFHQLSVEEENCREQVVCNMYKNPSAFTPLSDFLSRQLTVTYDQLTRPTVNDERILRFFKYLRAARAGQDGFDCAKEYTKCKYDTNNLSYKPIVNAYNKVSLLMNPSS